MKKDSNVFLINEKFLKIDDFSKLCLAVKNKIWSPYFKKKPVPCIP